MVSGYAGPIPTLEDLRQSSCWWWLYCDHCPHKAPIALVPFIIRWGPGTSSDKLRRSARCPECGKKGASLQHPGWADTQTGFRPFPTASTDGISS